jgi:flagellar biosynthesis chaperone FliJ
MEKQAKLIARLEYEIAAERNLRTKLEERIQHARKELIKAEHKLEDYFPDSSGGA